VPVPVAGGEYPDDGHEDWDKGECERPAAGEDVADRHDPEPVGVVPSCHRDDQRHHCGEKDGQADQPVCRPQRTNPGPLEAQRIDHATPRCGSSPPWAASGATSLTGAVTEAANSWATNSSDSPGRGHEGLLQRRALRRKLMACAAREQ
jgi:hypothetical protein